MTASTLSIKKLLAYLIVDDIEVDEDVTKKAQDGDASSLSKIAGIYYKKKDYTKAINWFCLAAAKDDAYSQYKIGLMYRYGYGVPQDYKIAMEWYLKAHSNGDIEAKCEIGQLYYFGYAVEKDYKVALKWFHEASRKGNSVAQNLIGDCYKDGKGVQKDEKYALEWYEKSFEGCAYSKGDIEKLNNKGIYITDRQRRCIQTQEDLGEQSLKIETLEKQLKASEQKQLKTDVEINQLKQQFEVLKLICNIDANNQAALEEENTDESSETTSNTTSDWVRTTTDEDCKSDEEIPENDNTYY